ncbi:MAG: hypothetical protein ACXVAO_18650 [Vulcanimicrobiaceae bacterium]
METLAIVNGVLVATLSSGTKHAVSLMEPRPLISSRPSATFLDEVLLMVSNGIVRVGNVIGDQFTVAQ